MTDVPCPALTDLFADLTAPATAAHAARCVRCHALLAAIGVANCIDKMDLYSELPKCIREANLVASSC